MVPNHLMDKLSQALLDLDNKVKLPDNNEVSRIRHGIERALKTIIDAVRENELPVNSTEISTRFAVAENF